MSHPRQHVVIINSIPSGADIDGEIIRKAKRALGEITTVLMAWPSGMAIGAVTKDTTDVISARLTREIAKLAKFIIFESVNVAETSDEKDDDEMFSALNEFDQNFYSELRRYKAR